MRGLLFSRFSGALILAVSAGLAVSSASVAETRRDSDCLVISNESNLVVEDIDIDGCNSDGIRIIGSTGITIRNVSINNATGVGVFIEDSDDVVVEESVISGAVSGIYALRSTGVGIQCNTITNPRGPVPRGQFVQFDKSFGKNSVACNWGVNEFGVGAPEDAINIYRSNGAPGNPITIRDNLLVGGGPSVSGGGILLGDDGGSHQVAVGNTLINPGQYGIGIASGEGISVLNNTVIAEKRAFTNVGIYVWNQYDTPCGDVSVSGNRVNWINRDGNPNPFWDNGNCGDVAGLETNELYFAPPDVEALRVPPAACQCELQGWRAAPDSP